MDARSKYTSVLVTYYAGVARDLPTISPYARELARSPRSVWPSDAVLVQAYRTDPFLCAKLCGVANSIFFNHNHQCVFTVEEALERVGVAYARNLLREAPSLPDDINEAEVGVYWAHCMSVAHSARAIASAAVAAPFTADVAHLVAMIHDIGYLLQIQYSSDALRKVARELEAGEPHYNSTAHASHGEELARFWYLPNPAISAIGCHHDPLACDDFPSRWLAQVVALSEGIVGRHSQLSSEISETRESAVVQDCVRELGIAQGLLTSLQEDADRVYDNCIRLVTNGHPETARASGTLQVVR